MLHEKVLAICLDPITLCNPNDPINKDRPKTPSIGSILDSTAGKALNAVVKAFTGSPQQNLDWALQSVVSAPLANLHSVGFVGIYRSLYALVAILIGPLVAIGIIASLRRSRQADMEGSAAYVVLEGFKVFIVGGIIPSIVAGGLWVVNKLDTQLYNVFKQSHFKNGLKLPNVGDNITDMFVSIFIKTEQIILSAMAVPVSLGVYLFTVMALVGYASSILRGGRIGNFARWNAAALATFTFAPLLWTGILVIGGSFANSVQGDRAKALVIFFLLGVAIVVPFMVLRWTKHQVDSVVENRGRTRVTGDVSTRSKNSVQQRRDIQSGLNGKLSAIASHQPGSGAVKHRGLKDVALVGLGAGLEHHFNVSAMKSAERGHHLRGAAKTYIHQRYIRPRTIGKVNGAKPTIPPVGRSKNSGTPPNQNRPPNTPPGPPKKGR